MTGHELNLFKGSIFSLSHSIVPDVRFMVEFVIPLLAYFHKQKLWHPEHTTDVSASFLSAVLKKVG
jgi:hypothetical protein